VAAGGEDLQQGIYFISSEPSAAELGPHTAPTLFALMLVMTQHAHMMSNSCTASAVAVTAPTATEYSLTTLRSSG